MGQWAQSLISPSVHRNAGLWTRSALGQWACDVILCISNTLKATGSPLPLQATQRVILTTLRLFQETLTPPLRHCLILRRRATRSQRMSRARRLSRSAGMQSTRWGLQCDAVPFRDM